MTGNKRRSYLEIMREYRTAEPGEQCRKLHRELKAMKRDGLPMFMRYPELTDKILLAVSKFIILPLTMDSCKYPILHATKILHQSLCRIYDIDAIHDIDGNL